MIPPLTVPRIGIFSPMGTGNLGDEATVAAIIQSIKRRFPAAQIYGICFNPTDTQARHNIPAFPACRGIRAVPLGTPHEDSKPKAPKAQPLRDRVKNSLKTLPVVYPCLKGLRNSLYFSWSFFSELCFLMQCLRILKGTDLLIIAGSGQLCDHFGGVSNFPYTIFKWSLLAKATGAKLAVLSAGAGPINAKLSKYLFKYALSVANYRSFRDEASKKLIEEIGVTGNNPIFPDLAHSLCMDKSAAIYHHKKSQLVVGINPFPHYDSRYWPVDDPKAYQAYIKKIAAFASWLIHNNYKVLFFPTQIRVDTLVIKDIQSIMIEEKNLDFEENISECSMYTVEELICHLSMVDIVVATRFHGILLSFLLNKPVIAISNHHKMTELMINMEQSEYVLNIDDFDLTSLIKLFTVIECKRDIVKEEVMNKISEYRSILEEQYKVLFALIDRED